jgi:hypothetical protein
VIDLFESYGSRALSGWRVEHSPTGSDVFWIQTTSKAFARKLRKRKDTRRVEVTGCNHFRETFELHGTWTKIKRIIDHYILSAGDQFAAVNGLLTASQTKGGPFMSPIKKPSYWPRLAYSSHATLAPRRRRRAQLELTSTP